MPSVIAVLVLLVISGATSCTTRLLLYKSNRAWYNGNNGASYTLVFTVLLEYAYTAILALEYTRSATALVVVNPIKLNCLLKLQLCLFTILMACCIACSCLFMFYKEQAKDNIIQRDHYLDLA